MNISINGEMVTSADVRQLRDEVIFIRNNFLGPEIFDGKVIVTLSKLIMLLGNLAIIIDQEKQL